MTEVECLTNPERRFTALKLSVPSSQNSSKQLIESHVASRRILVVDDEIYITWMLQEGLEKIPNCEVLTATKAEQALQLMKKQPFDLLITDYKMPGIDGLVLATSVRQLSPRTAVVMLTAHNEETLRERAGQIPIRYILKKPVTLPQIRSVASEVLANMDQV